MYTLMFYINTLHQQQPAQTHAEHFDIASSMDDPAPDNAVPLEGGNIVVPHGGSQ